MPCVPSGPLVPGRCLQDHRHFSIVSRIWFRNLDFQIVRIFVSWVYLPRSLSDWFCALQFFSVSSSRVVTEAQPRAPFSLDLVIFFFLVLGSMTSLLFHPIFVSRHCVLYVVTLTGVLLRFRPLWKLFLAACFPCETSSGLLLLLLSS